MAVDVVRLLSTDGADVGILVCGTGAGMQIAAAAAVAVAAASSLALAHSLRSSARPARTATRIVTSPSLQQDIVSQHILAMERKLVPSSTLRLGPVLAL